MQPDIRGPLIKKAAIWLGILTVVTVSSTYGIPVVEKTIENKKAEIVAEENRQKEKLLSMSGIELIQYANESTNMEFEKQQLCFKLPFGCKGDKIEVEGKALEKTYTLEIPYADENYIYDWSVTGDTEVISNLEYNCRDRVGEINLTMNGYYEYTTRYDQNYFTLEFLTPKQIYGNILIIDAGGGGEDLGISKFNVDEKQINLDIVLEMKRLLRKQTNVGIFYTRIDDTTMAQEEREKFAEDLQADLIVSVRMNHTPSGMVSAINGAQVAYTAGNEDTEELAQDIQNRLVDKLEMSDKGLQTIEEEEGFINTEIPTVIVKPGFISNKGDLEIMSKDESRDLAAEAIYEALVQYYMER